MKAEIACQVVEKNTIVFIDIDADQQTAVNDPKRLSFYSEDV